MNIEIPEAVSITLSANRVDIKGPKGNIELLIAARDESIKS